MAVVDDVGGNKKVAWLNDNIQHDHFQEISDKTFYQEFPELAPFDNGEGFWTAGLNRDVEMREFVEHGRQLLKQKGNTNPDEGEAFKVAADKLLEILEGRGADFARLYINNVLERPVSAKLLEIGGSHFYTSHLTKPFSEKGFENDRDFDMDIWDYPRLCREYNQVSYDGLGQFSFSISRDSFFHPKEGGAPISACLVDTTTLNLNQEDSRGRFKGETGYTYFARTEKGEKLSEKRWSGENGILGRYETGEGASSLSAAFYFYDDIHGASAEYMDTRRRAGILASYLSIKSD